MGARPSISTAIADLEEVSASEIDLTLDDENAPHTPEEEALLASGTRPVTRHPSPCSDMLDPPTEELEAVVDEPKPRPRRKLKMRRSWIMMTDEESQTMSDRITAGTLTRSPVRPFGRELAPPNPPPRKLPHFPLLPSDPAAPKPHPLPHLPLLPPDPKRLR